MKKIYLAVGILLLVILGLAIYGFQQSTTLPDTSTPSPRFPTPTLVSPAATALPVKSIPTSSTAEDHQHIAAPALPSPSANSNPEPGPNPPTPMNANYALVKQIAVNMTIRQNPDEPGRVSKPITPTSGWDIYYLNYGAPSAPDPRRSANPADQAKNTRRDDVEIRLKVFPTVADAQKGIIEFVEFRNVAIPPVEKEYGDEVYSAQPNVVIFRRNNVLVLLQTGDRGQTTDDIAATIDAALLKTPLSPAAAK